MSWAPWSAAWTREHLLGYMPAEELFYSQWSIAEGTQRRWFLRFRKLGEDQVYFVPVLSQTFLTTGTGVQSATSDATWNNASNQVEIIAGGGSGGSSQRGSSPANCASGAGGGEYGITTNFNFATPGTTTFQYQIGQGGTAVNPTVGAVVNTAGNNGTDSWFNGATQAGATLGAIHGNGGGTGTNPAGGAGGTGGVGTTHFAGGRGGNITGSASNISSGAGGAGGNTAIGSNGTDNATAGTSSTGGAGGATGGGSGGAISGGAGGAGTNFDATHGAGGGGGGRSAGLNSSVAGGAAGLYGAGSGGCSNTGAGGNASTRATTPVGGIGIVVLTWTPAGGAAQVYIFSQSDTSYLSRLIAVGY